MGPGDPRTVSYDKIDQVLKIFSKSYQYSPEFKDQFVKFYISYVEALLSFVYYSNFQKLLIDIRMQNIYEWNLWNFSPSVGLI